MKGIYYLKNNKLLVQDLKNELLLLKVIIISFKSIIPHRKYKSKSILLIKLKFKILQNFE